MNDNYDDNEGIQIEEISNSEDADNMHFKEENNSGDVNETREDIEDAEVPSTEELLDDIKLTNDSPFTYGEYREALNNPDHHLNNPEDPQYEAFQQAKEGFQESMRDTMRNLSDHIEMPKIDIEKIFPKIPKAQSLGISLENIYLKEKFAEKFKYTHFNEKLEEKIKNLYPNEKLKEKVEDILDSSEPEIKNPMLPTQNPKTHRHSIENEYIKPSYLIDQSEENIRKMQKSKEEREAEENRRYKEDREIKQKFLLLFREVSAQLKEQKTITGNIQDYEVKWHDEQRESQEKEGRKSTMTLVFTGITLVFTGISVFLALLNSHSAILNNLKDIF